MPSPSPPRPFLTAEWRHLAMVSYEADPERLRPFVPSGTELDLHEGRAFVSVVGFLFLETRVLGVPIPFHRRFEEVNLRLYVRREAADGWRRGVVFVKEVVPLRAVTWVARTVYEENYVTHPMRHEIQEGVDGPGDASARYAWSVDGDAHHVGVRSVVAPVQPREGSLDRFIAEHYWGYSSRRDGSTMEYRVEHPPWRVRAAAEADLRVDAAGFYGEPFGEILRGEPASAFLAEGSAITVHRGTCRKP